MLTAIFSWQKDEKILIITKKELKHVQILFWKILFVANTVV